MDEITQCDWDDLSSVDLEDTRESTGGLIPELGMSRLQVFIAIDLVHALPIAKSIQLCVMRVAVWSGSHVGANQLDPDNRGQQVNSGVYDLEASRHVMLEETVVALPLWVSEGRVLLVNHNKDTGYRHILGKVTDDGLDVVYDKHVDIDASRMFGSYSVVDGRTIVGVVEQTDGAISAYNLEDGSKKWHLDNHLKPGDKFHTKERYRFYSDAGHYDKRLVATDTHIYCAMERTIELSFRKYETTYHILAINAETGERDWVSDPIKVPKKLKYFQVLAIVDDCLLLWVNKTIQCWRPAS